MESILKEKIESLRFEMNDRACHSDSLTDESVVNVSQQLDRYLFVYQKLLKRSKRKRR